MLVIARKAGESFRIGEEIFVTVLARRGSEVRLGIVAPPSVPVVRDDAKERVERQSGGAG